MPAFKSQCNHKWLWKVFLEKLFESVVSNRFCFFSSPYHRHLCRPCHNREKARGLGKYICQKCHAIIEEQPLIFKNDPYHPDHFNCNNCGSVLLLTPHWFEHKPAHMASEYIWCLFWACGRVYKACGSSCVCATERNWQLKPENWRGSSTVCRAMTRWVYQFVAPVGDPLRGVLSMPWASSGTWRFVKDETSHQLTWHNVVTLKSHMQLIGCIETLLWT